MNTFPFPDRDLSREELKRDVLYQRIPQEDRARICGIAWDRGAETAKKILKKYQGKPMCEIAEQEGVSLTVLQEDAVNSFRRTFGEYDIAKKEIVLYADSIAKWAEANGLSAEDAEELILAHEFYHFLECTQIGESSKLYQVPIWKIGKFVLVKSGVRALSEISAHGFSRTCFEAYRDRNA